MFSDDCRICSPKQGLKSNRVAVILVAITLLIVIPIVVGTLLVGLVVVVVVFIVFLVGRTSAIGVRGHLRRARHIRSCPLPRVAAINSRTPSTLAEGVFLEIFLEQYRRDYQGEPPARIAAQEAAELRMLLMPAACRRPAVRLIVENEIGAPLARMLAEGREPVCGWASRLLDGNPKPQSLLGGLFGRDQQEDTVEDLASSPDKVRNFFWDFGMEPVSLLFIEEVLPRQLNVAPGPRALPPAVGGTQDVDGDGVDQGDERTAEELVNALDGELAKDSPNWDRPTDYFIELRHAASAARAKPGSRAVSAFLRRLDAYEKRLARFEETFARHIAREPQEWAGYLKQALSETMKSEHDWDPEGASLETLRRHARRLFVTRPAEAGEHEESTSEGRSAVPASGIAVAVERAQIVDVECEVRSESKSKNGDADKASEMGF
jgi:hypothetical protein